MKPRSINYTRFFPWPVSVCMACVLLLIYHIQCSDYLKIMARITWLSSYFVIWCRKERENKQNGIVDPDEVGGGRGGRRRGAGGSRGGALQRRTKTHDQFTKVWFHSEASEGYCKEVNLVNLCLDYDISSKLSLFYKMRLKMLI